MHKALLLIDENYKYLGHDKKLWPKKIQKEIDKYYTENSFCDWANVGGRYEKLLSCKNKAGLCWWLNHYRPKYKPTGYALQIANIWKKVLKKKKLTPKENKLFKEFEDRWQKESKIQSKWNEEFEQHSQDIINSKYTMKCKRADTEFLDLVNILCEYVNGKEPIDKSANLIFEEVWETSKDQCDVCEIKDLTKPIPRDEFTSIEFFKGVCPNINYESKEFDKYIDQIDKKKVKGVIVVLDVHY